MRNLCVGGIGMSMKSGNEMFPVRVESEYRSEKNCSAVSRLQDGSLLVCFPLVTSSFMKL